MHDRTNGPHVHILGLRINALTQKQLLGLLKAGVGEGKKQLVVTANPELALEVWNKPEYATGLNSLADYMTADGTGLWLAAPFFGRFLTERITGVQLVRALLIEAEKMGWVVGIAMPPDGLLNETVCEEYFKQTYPKLRYQIFKITAQDFSHQNFSHCQVLISSHGMPNQERLLLKLKHEGRGVPIMIGAGASLDFLTGIVPYAPCFLRKFGLEWAYRLLESWLSRKHRKPRVVTRSRAHRIARAVLLFPLACLAWKLRSLFFYRPAVVLCLFNKKHDILIAEWHDNSGHWHVPQGGVEPRETFEEAARRELREEVGLEEAKLLKIVPNVYRYTWPRNHECRLWWGYLGQRQTFCYFELAEPAENLKADQVELGALRWVALEQLEKNVMPHKRQTARLIIKHLPYELKNA